eukprot:TRINITY_DN17010_c0_g1_i1.p1 TRINITY_DN17010_c0_g1~~TRINITY_DN17010_c0_g1_i1.p1  ORF type:complete len:132 (+),score=8.11 TRINITY_DN17010_c0_g1_i1:38-433(+)
MREAEPSTMIHSDTATVAVGSGSLIMLVVIAMGWVSAGSILAAVLWGLLGGSSVSVHGIRTQEPFKLMGTFLASFATSIVFAFLSLTVHLTLTGFIPLLICTSAVSRRAHRALEAPTLPLLTAVDKSHLLL